MLIFPLRRNSAWGRGKDVWQSSKAKAIRSLLARKDGVVSAQSRPSPPLHFLTTPPTLGTRFVYTQGPPLGVCACPAPLEPGLESSTWSTGLLALAHTPRQSAARYHQGMAIREMKNPVLRSFQRTRQSLCGLWLAGLWACAVAAWGWRRRRVPYRKG